MVPSTNNKFISNTCLKYKKLHVAIIMDGNGRWAKKRGQIRAFGHKEGAKSVRRAIYFAVENKINILTLYAFSIENWNRPTQEINTLMELFMWALNNEKKIFKNHNIRFRIIGDISRFSIQLQKLIHKTELSTADNTGMTLNIAANYSGRWDIVQGVQNLVREVQKGLLNPDQINEKELNKYICMNELSPVDLVIRTGGEYRISNFLLWQIAYSEFYFTNVLWPDFNEKDFQNALNIFFNRERRFGRIEIY